MIEVMAAALVAMAVLLSMAEAVLGLNCGVILDLGFAISEIRWPCVRIEGPIPV